MEHTWWYCDTRYEWCRSFYKDREYLLDLMLIADHFVLNEDRHYGNFGLIRNVNTGEFVSPAPIFDNGNSMFFGSLKLNPDSLECKPFHKKFEHQIKHINVLEYAEYIHKILNCIDDIFWDSFKDSFEDKMRLQGILNIIKERGKQLTISL